MHFFFSCQAPLRVACLQLDLWALLSLGSTMKTLLRVHEAHNLLS